ncbi:hypothetical protein [Azohydromonas australica]|uniref:hypothetical protein n=1 Tax=Azohydromonas australica TaxID=364039 RepID=UPI0012EBECFC|nr:hypothetical protein [Azohydromonas australica]
MRTAAFDKTGTLAEGKPKLEAHEAVDGDAAALLSLAAAMQAHSEHPLPRAAPSPGWRTWAAMRCC